MKYTLAIDDGLNLKKITKIITYNDGGFAIAVPYHAAKKGYLIKYKADYSKRINYTKRSEMINYVASDRVKLSIHPDGFVQFSGENPGKILSGRDENGTPKGLGYLTSTLSNPITTGPTCGILVWGLDDYVDLGTPKSGEEIVLFNKQNTYFRTFAEDLNGYLIELFVFPYFFYSGVRKDFDNKLILEMCFKNFEAFSAVIKLKVVPTESKEYFLGLMASKIKAFPKLPSGFSLIAPGELKSPKESIGTLMAAIYPAPDDLGEILHFNNLDYSK